ncbi:hypothetical protein AB0J89_19820 [Micromonospora chokoriensis]
MIEQPHIRMSGRSQMTTGSTTADLFGLAEEVTEQEALASALLVGFESQPRNQIDASTAGAKAMRRAT